MSECRTTLDPFAGDLWCDSHQREAGECNGSHYGMATAGNNRKVHLIRQTLELHYVSMCGVMTPRRPQTTQESLPKCRRCFGES